MKPLIFKSALIIALLLLTSNQSTIALQSSTETLTFTAVGDFGASVNTAAVLDTIAASGASFHLALGDMSYGALRPESSWCDFVKSHVGSEFPFELIAGNHDSGQIAYEGNITNFAACLPDRIGTITGTYGKEYYFDYPAAAPLARFILISPKIDFVPEGAYSYANGSAHYNWVENTIDNARAAGIPWVIVGMHKNCIGVGGHACDLEPALFNLLIRKKVDLILHGHNHNYQRSKQLALSAACTAITANSFNSNCVVDDGADDRYTKDAGSVIVIAGMGGHTIYDINTTDPEFGYFAKLMGGNANPTNGTVRFTVSDTQLTSGFVRASGGDFRDNFSITKLASMPTATPTPTGQPPTPTPSGNTIYAADTFTRNVTDGWGRADTGGSYTPVGAAAHFDVDGSAGTINVPLPGSVRSAILPDVVGQDLDFTFRVKTDKLAAGSNQSAYFVGRRVATNTEYWGQIRITPSRTVYLQAVRVVNGSQTNIAPAVRVNGLSHAANSYIRVRGQIEGTNPTTIRLKAWADGQAEPATWFYTVTDSTSSLQTAGAVGLRALIPGSVTNAPVLFTFDDLLVTQPSATSPPTATSQPPTATQTPTSTTPPTNNAIADDTFSRMVTGGWGSAETGGAYSGTAFSDFNVNGNEGTITIAVAGRQRQATLSGINVRDVDMKLRIKTDKLAAGARHNVSLLARHLGNAGQYRARLELAPNGSVTLLGQKYLTSTNVTTNIGSVVTVSGLTHTANRFIWLRVQVVGANPTTIRIKAWADGQPEPSAWQYTSTDSEAALQTSGSVAILTRLHASSTAAPVVFTFDDFSVISP